MHQVRGTGIITPEKELKQIYPVLAPVSANEVYRDVSLPAQSVVTNFVTTVDGRGTINDSSSQIGSKTDHMLMKRVRSLVDAVVHGAGTVRAEGLFAGVPQPYTREREARGLQPQPLCVLVGGHAKVRIQGDPARLRETHVVVFVPQRAPEPESPVEIGIHRLEGDHPRPEDVVRVLAKHYGATRLLVEGGPTINNAFLQAGLINELFWTLAPKVAGGGDAPNMFEGPALPSAARLKLVSIYENEGELYLRYATSAS